MLPPVDCDSEKSFARKGKLDSLVTIHQWRRSIFGMKVDRNIYSCSGQMQGAKLSRRSLRLSKCIISRRWFGRDLERLRVQCWKAICCLPKCADMPPCSSFQRHSEAFISLIAITLGRTQGLELLAYLAYMNFSQLYSLARRYSPGVTCFFR